MSFLETLSPKNQKNCLLPISEKYQNIATNTSLFLFGKSGSGKTALALQIAQKVEQENKSLRINFVKFGELVNSARKSYDKNYYTRRDAEDYLKTINQSDLLIIDDLGTEKNTEFVDQFIYELIDHRYEYELPTIITSNFSLDEISEKYHERIASRIVAMCKVVRLAEVDFRLEVTDKEKEFNFDSIFNPVPVEKDNYNPYG